MQAFAPKPVRRSPFRVWAGSCYFTLRRHLRWAFGGLRFAVKDDAVLLFRHTSHKTPLLRKLQGVDMRLQHNKITNLKLAVAQANQVTLRPGEVFSYWKTIGKPTRAKGYVEGVVLQNGAVTSGIGGGLCQLSNLIYWLTLHTPLTVIERHRHGYDVFPDSNRTQPFGSGATCFYNYVDLMIRNDTDQTFQLLLDVSDTDLVGAWASDQPQKYIYEVYEQEHRMQSEFWGGHTRRNVLRRKKYNLTGELIADEFVVENTAVMMYPLCRRLQVRTDKFYRVVAVGGSVVFTEQKRSASVHIELTRFFIFRI
jgi:vancomycin resistance protein VanW